MSGRLGRVLPVYVKLAWWGLVGPRVPGRKPLVVVHGVILSEHLLQSESRAPSTSRFRMIRREQGRSYRRGGHRLHRCPGVSCSVVYRRLGMSPHVHDTLAAHPHDMH